MTYLADPRVAEAVMTCGACPEQYSTLVDGRPFYFRYRHGYASLAVGDDCDGRQDVGVEHYNHLPLHDAVLEMVLTGGVTFGEARVLLKSPSMPSTSGQLAGAP